MYEDSENIWHTCNIFGIIDFHTKNVFKKYSKGYFHGCKHNIWKHIYMRIFGGKIHFKTNLETFKLSKLFKQFPPGPLKLGSWWNRGVLVDIAYKVLCHYFYVFSYSVNVYYVLIIILTTRFQQIQIGFFLHVYVCGF